MAIQMKCRKCGCEILESTRYCEMCGTKQRQSKVSKSQSSEMIPGHYTRSGLNSVAVAIISGLVALSIIGVVVILFNLMDFGQSDERVGVVDQTTETLESEIVEVPETDSSEQLEESNNTSILGATFGTFELSANDAFIMNQTGDSWLITSFVTEDAIYFIESGGTVVTRTIDYFATSEVVADLGHWTSSFHITEDAIYYTVTGEMDWDAEIDWEEVEWIQYLYRYDLSSGENIQVADEIFNEVIVGDLVFHQRESFEGGLYVLDLTTGDRELLVADVDSFRFVVDAENDRIIFTSSSWEDRQVYQMSLSGENKAVLLEDAFDFVVGNNLLVWQVGREVNLMNLDTNETTVVQSDDGLQLWSSAFIGQYFVVRCHDNYLWIIDTNDISSRYRIVNDVLSFTLLGNYIVYSDWENWENIYITDLFGNSEIFRSFLD